MIDNPEHIALTEGVFLILLSMLQPRHGYSAMQYVGKMTKGRVVLGAGTLYGAINTLSEKQWIRAVSESRDSRKKEYVITAVGKTILKNEMARLEGLLLIGKDELGGTLI
ncbi:MAG: PadR family transcriptional regulator [Peptococcaceae bacterium]|nr:PadR family transcriptional regulator [Peptococcaceae bacterium]